MGTYFNFLVSVEICYFTEYVANFREGFIRYWETQNNSTKIKNETRLSILSVSIQYSTQTFSKGDKTTKRNQEDKKIGKEEVEVSLVSNDMTYTQTPPKALPRNS